MSSCPRGLLVPVSLLAFCVCALSSIAWGQASYSEQVAIKPPLFRTIDPPAPDATASSLEFRAEQLRASKLYLDALDYYHAALFAKKEFDPAVDAYQHAMDIDPDVFERTSRGGVQAQLPSPGDRARYDFTVAKLYAKMGYSDRSLEYLKKALEAGYKDMNSVYKSVEFAELRKDKRFVELMAAKPAALTE
jgi:tetratricopeptide (TPR) repeat protein